MTGTGSGGAEAAYGEGAADAMQGSEWTVREAVREAELRTGAALREFLAKRVAEDPERWARQAAMQVAQIELDWTAPERIAGVEVQHGSERWVGGPPTRHHHMLWAMATGAGGMQNVGEDQSQGFVTSHGRYVDRSEAWEIATREGQVTGRLNDAQGKRQAAGATLFSEDLW